MSGSQSGSQTREAINREVDSFSIAVLDYDRNNPRAEQRRPGDVLREVEERMKLVKERTERRKRLLGALILAAATTSLTSGLTIGWPTLLHLLGLRP